MLLGQLVALACLDGVSGLSGGNRGEGVARSASALVHNIFDDILISPVDFNGVSSIWRNDSQIVVGGNAGLWVANFTDWGATRAGDSVGVNVQTGFTSRAFSGAPSADSTTFATSRAHVAAVVVLSYGALSSGRS